MIDKHNNRPSLPSSRPASGVDLPQTLQKLQRKAKNRFAELLSIVFNKVDDNLFDLASRAENGNDQNLYFEAMREIRIRRREFELTYRKRFDTALQELMVETPVAIDIPLKKQELSLIDNQHLEQMVALESMVAKANTANHEALLMLTARMDSLVPVSLSEIDKNPLSPKSLAETFVAQTESIKIDIRSRLMLFKLFDKHVLSELPNFYLECNQQLGADGVMTALNSAQAHNALSAPASDTQTPTTENLNSLDKGLPGEAFSGMAQTDETTAECVVQQPRENTVQENVFRQVQHLMTHSPRYQNTPYQRARLGPRAKVVSRQQVVDALSLLQQEIPTLLQNEAVDEQGYSIDSLTRDDLRLTSQLLLEQLARTAQNSGQQHQIGQLDEDAINLVEMLFAFILDDDNIVAEIKLLISRLQIPLIKVAMLDKALFNDDQHPARGLLNELSMAGLGWHRTQGKRRDALYNKIEQAVLTVSQEFSEDISVFVRVLAEFTAFREAEERRSRLVEQRTITAEQGKATAEKARQRVNQLLYQRVVVGQKKNPNIPRVVLRFLGTQWCDVLFLIFLREGTQGKQWQRAMMLVDNLLWAVRPLSSDRDRQRLLKVMPALLRSLRSGLTQVGRSDFSVNEMFDQLQALLQANIEGQIQQISASLEKTTDACVLPLSPLDKALAGASEDLVASDDQDDSQAQKDSQEQIDAMAVGSWIEVAKENKHRLRAKLATVIQPIERYIFVNRSGIKVADWLRNEFAKEVACGKVKVLNRGLLFDRAIKNIISNLEPMKDKKHR